METATSKAPFDYFGGKSKVVNWIYELMPSQIPVLVDVFGGSGNVAFGCSFSKVRIYNDVDQEIVNFMRVLRDSADTLITQIELTPHSRNEYCNAFTLYRSDRTG